jgi:DUF438 domain-containing protein
MIDRMNEKIIKALYEHVPVEITVIDENDEVVGWNKHDSRLFKRPLNSLGMNFRNCHPEESLGRVIAIIEEMRNGLRQKARFWIDLQVPYDTKKHKILIEFYALRDDEGRYLGCMECTQDVEEIRAIEGEKRLLDKK